MTKNTVIRAKPANELRSVKVALTKFRGIQPRGQTRGKRSQVIGAPAARSGL
ncbi:hypothetical protein BH11PSE3_BH11PSE3_45410 [soil metagenome]